MIRGRVHTRFSRDAGQAMTELIMHDIYDLRGPLKYGRDSTEYDRTVVKASSQRSTHVLLLLLVRSYHEEDLDDENDYKFWTMILFLPQCGVAILLWVPESVATRMWGWR